jgi:hypothetical protein
MERPQDFTSSGMGVCGTIITIKFHGCSKCPYFENGVVKINSRKYQFVQKCNKKNKGINFNTELKNGKPLWCDYE